ncbi:MAG: Asp-tRNA(Asn)/Glu-tRNA(Gln) amidotransferase subunit GatA [Clostridia bacterium]|nr:Asp-tRNA(Asn)/Glu-tRNA(Gln) amidotransferase subunit GatA [Clostridia bacterium]
MELYHLTVSSLAKKIKEKEITIKEVLDNLYTRIEAVEQKVDAYITLTKEYAYERAKILQERLDAGEDIGIMGGVPIAIKDNICTNGIKTTCASKMLENFVPFYNATVIEKLENAGAIIIGKANMDEFAMGSSTENSAIKKTKNPWDNERVPGGSSGGSAAAVSSEIAYCALGTDTGGSIRQPASFCSVVGLKPTYGLVSRYGVVAYASSLDQVGPITKSVEDAALLLNVIAGNDKKDSTSANLEKKDYLQSLINDIQGKKLGVPKKFIETGLNADVKKAYEDALQTLEDLGAEIVDISLDYAKYSLPTYYIIATAEASSNLGRYDGIRYGHRAKNFDSLEELYVKSRTEGFGDEVKRRIMLGTYVLSAGYYDAYYKRGQQVRTLIIEDFKKAFETCDAIVIPTTPNTSFKFGEKTSNPIEMYLEDIFTVPVNIAGLPAISVPGGFDTKGMPIGMQFISKAFDEETLLQIAYTFEQNTNFHESKPTI